MFYAHASKFHKFQNIIPLLVLRITMQNPNNCHLLAISSSGADDKAIVMEFNDAKNIF